MDRERIKAVLDEALNMPAAERDAFIEASCADDPSALHEVKLLLEAGDRASGFFDIPSIDREADTAGINGGARPAFGVEPGVMIGRYKILQQIGEGGFGVVYMAEQERPVRRRVALKILKPGIDTDQVLARFEAERQALALMEHPNIAKVLDAGETETSRPYFAMELVRGDPITTYCDRESLSTQQRLSLFRRVCLAVQHAHMKGVIHRDIKPTNILVGTVDGEPVPKVIDFGVAKATSVRLTERTLFTEFRQLIGTPEFMSPEQADTASLTDVDTRTDVYSLGVLLYELLTGAPPFPPEQLRDAGFGEMLRIIRETDPPKPSTRLSTMGDAIEEIARHRREQPGRLGTVLRGELDWIVMKALEKDRGRRYSSAEAFGQDVGRYLADEAVEASPPSALYRARKFARRNRGVVTAATAVLVALVLGFIGTTSGLFWALGERASAREAESRAIENESVARESAFEALMLSAGQAKRDGKYAEAAGMLDQIREDDRTHWWRVARAMSSTRYEVHSTGPARWRWNADHSLVSALHEGRLDIRDGATLELIGTLREPFGPNDIGRVKWTSDPEVFVLMLGGFRMYNARTLQQIGPLTASVGDNNPGVIEDRFAAQYTVDGDDLIVRVLDLRAGELSSEKRLPGLGWLGGPLKPIGGGWMCCNRNESGPVLAVRGPGLDAHAVIDAQTSRVRRPWAPGNGAVLRRDGLRVECWWLDESGTPAFGWEYQTESRVTGVHIRDAAAIINTVRLTHLVDVATGQPLSDPIDVGTSSPFVDLDWESRRLLVDVSRLQTRLYHLGDWTQPYSVRVANTSARKLLLTPDARVAFSTNYDPHFRFEAGGIRVIDAAGGVEIARLLGPRRLPGAVAISPDGTMLASQHHISNSGTVSRWDRTLSVWSLRSGRRLWSRPYESEYGGLRFSDDGISLLSGSTRLEARTGRVLEKGIERPEGSLMDEPPGRPYEIVYGPSVYTPWIGVHERATGKLVQRFESSNSFLPQASLSHDNTRIVLPERLMPPGVFDLHNGRRLGTLPEYTTDTMAIAWSPDDSVIATAGEDAVIRLWDSDSLELLGALAGHSKYVHAMAFSPDGRSLYTVSGDGMFRIWNDRTPWEQAEFVAARRAIYDRLRPEIERIVDGSTDENADDAWAAMGDLGLEGEDAQVGEMLLIGTLLTRFGG